MNENISSETSNSDTASGRDTGRLIQQIGINMFTLGVLALLGFLVWQRFFQPQAAPLAELLPTESVDSRPLPTIPPLEKMGVEIALSGTPVASLSDGIFRRTDGRTIIPTRPRVDVITYTVQLGDTLFSIAGNFNLKPETILWGNFEVLDDNPHLLKPNQVLNILPVNGVYYRWQVGDTLAKVAEEFKVDMKVIIDFPGNPIDLTKAYTDDPGISVGTWLIIPGGKRAIKDWGPPAITRKNAAAAKYYGEGACPAVYEGAIGTGTFIWPTTDRTISGYAYDPAVHPAIDIGGAVGNPIYATDSGVVVYAGWSSYGYGYLIVIDHGNGWQSAYAHLSAVAVSCGQSVYQGGYIGALGSTGNSSGPHLHFELVINGVKINPLDYIR